MWSFTGDGGVREVVAMRELTVVVYHSSKIPDCCTLLDRILVTT